MSGSAEYAEEEFEVETSKSPIQCVRLASTTQSLSNGPSLVFTHGSGGTLKSDAIANFARGFATHSPIVCFQGNMNLSSRVKSFQAVSDDLGFSKILGGRSMGARAAIMAATGETSHLVLASYPLHTGQQTRDEILLNLPESTKVIFVIGENDNMCNLSRLEAVRSKMKCVTWLVVVSSADHGMNVKPKAGTRDVGILTGEVVAQWLQSPNQDARKGQISWDSEQKTASWSGWSKENPMTEILSDQRPEPISQPARSGRKRTRENPVSKTTKKRPRR